MAEYSERWPHLSIINSNDILERVRSEVVIATGATAVSGYE